MPEGATPYQYAEDVTGDGVTALAGLPVCLDLIAVMRLSASVRRHVQVRLGGRGWCDATQVVSLVLLNIAGGDCVEDIDGLEADRGLCRILARLRVEEFEDLNRQQRRALLREWERAKARAVPSVSAVRRYLEEFHDETQEALRRDGKSFIPKPNRPLAGLRLVNGDVVAFVQERSPSATATLDIDATLVFCSKEAALHSYKGPKAYQPLNVWWAEQKVVLHTEFRDGNVPAGYENLRVLVDALELLPKGVKEVCVRSDTAGYDHELLRYLDRGLNARFGRIKFGISCDVTPEFKKAVTAVPERDWQPILRLNPTSGRYEQTALECAEVCYVPNEASRSKHGTPYRYLATREPMDQPRLPHADEAGGQQRLPFPTLAMGERHYKLHGIVTNVPVEEFSAPKIVEWCHERCGYAEQAHSMMKSDFAGAKLPSQNFGANAAWWWIMVLSLNVMQAMKQLVLGPEGSTKRMKALRFQLFNIPGRVVEHARQLYIKLAKGHPAFGWLIKIRQRILALAPTPAG
jgi:hypothetical protein